MISIQNWNTYSESRIYINFFFRNDDQEEESQKVQILSVAPVVSPETRPHTLGSDMGLTESSIREPQREDSDGDSMLTFHVSEVKEYQYNMGWLGVYSPFKKILRYNLLTVNFTLFSVYFYKL